jgi:hypothetical protein
MIPPRFMALHRMVHSAWSIGSLAMRLAMAAPPLPGKMTPLHPDHFHHQGA